MISNHSLVTAFLTAHHQADPICSHKVRSCKKVELSVFREAIRESAVANSSPSSMLSELFEIYDTCLRHVADGYVPEHTACSKGQTTITLVRCQLQCHPMLLLMI